MSLKTHKMQCGNTERVSFSKIHNTIDMPYLIEVQKDSYDTFIAKGIKEVFEDFSPITDYSGKLELEFLEHTLEGECKYSVKECKERDATYTSPLKVKARVTNKETGEMNESWVFMGDIPKMTDSGTFIINGAERVIVSQLVRSPGVYTTGELDKHGVRRYMTQVIPNRGAWLEFEQEAQDTLAVRVDRQRKMPVTVLLRALGFGTDKEISDLFANDPMILKSLEKDSCEDKSTRGAKYEMYRRLKPGEIPTETGVEALLHNYFFDARRYDLSRVGRYKFNKKLNLATRIEGKVLAQDIISPDGEVLAEKGMVLSHDQAVEIQNLGVNEAFVEASNGDVAKVIGNASVDLNYYLKGLNVTAKDLGVEELAYYPVLAPILDRVGSDPEALVVAIKENLETVVAKHITVEDIVATVNYNINMKYGFEYEDNIDHLSNRRVRSVGELLQNQFRIGIAKLERGIRDRMAVAQDLSQVTPQSLINVRPVTSSIREFFGSSQLSQFMDQPNPIAELTHKRKLSALGPGGLNRERAGMEVRDVHHSHYGRMCPIETPEGQNIGLITSLSSYAKVNEYGFIEAPYRKVDKATGIVTDEVSYLQADEEDKYIVAQANEPLTEDGRFVNERVTCRFRADIKEYPRETVDYMDVSPQQLVSVAAALIPFLENDDANRALMGSNMQRQAVPLLKPEAPIIGTGMEWKVAHDSGVCVVARNDGTVVYADATRIEVKTADGVDTYNLRKFERSNQGTCINQRPIVKKGQVVTKGAVIADGPSCQNGELALGRNILIGFMTWEGYNYEDAVLISEELVKNDVFTSVHIEEYEIESRKVKIGEEQITRDIPNVSEDLLKYLDEDGIVMVGAEVRSGDYLVGKVTPKGETELTPEERLLKAVFGDKAKDVRDVSLKVPHGEAGTVVDVKVFTRENKDELPVGVNKLVRVYIAQKRKIRVGDKMSGRHGNKGVISRVLPKEDMPFLPDGTPLQIVLNPLGVPSRMNIGQVLEVHLGLVANQLGVKIATPVFDGAAENDIKELFEANNLPENGKIQLYDGRTGEPFENKVTVGYMYMLKLNHLVDDKIHARSVGPYSLITQQPLGGKAQFGGQRFGEMEVWALEAYGAANTLQEVLTVKSDDVQGRNKMFDSIVKSNTTAEPGIPESFKVLRMEMQALGLDVKLLTEGAEEVIFNENYDDEREFKTGGSKPTQEIDIAGMDNDGLFSDNDDIGGGLFDEDTQDVFNSLTSADARSAIDVVQEGALLDDDEDDDDLFSELTETDDFLQKEVNVDLFDNDEE